MELSRPFRSIIDQSHLSIFNQSHTTSIILWMKALEGHKRVFLNQIGPTYKEGDKIQACGLVTSLEFWPNNITFILDDGTSAIRCRSYMYPDAIQLGSRLHCFGRVSLYKELEFQISKPILVDLACECYFSLTLFEEFKISESGEQD
jgi:hypothetical protein